MTTTDKECVQPHPTLLGIPADSRAFTSGLEVGAELRAIRQAIDAMDDDITALLTRRADLSRQAQVIKRRVGLPVFNRDRETEIQRRYERAAVGSSSVAVAILRWCRALAREDQIDAENTGSTEVRPTEGPRDDSFPVLASNPA